MSETDYCGTRDKTASEQEMEYGFNVLKCCLWQFINVLHCVYLKFMAFWSKPMQLAKKEKQRAEREKENYVANDLSAQSGGYKIYPSRK